MKFHLRIIAGCLAAALLLASTAGLRAFALLGPVQPWMQATNGVILPSDIGGPMAIGNGYRWNVPMLTYGFDQSFLDFFGSNGVLAVEQAFTILNDLPPASEMVLTNYPDVSESINYRAQGESLYDLKSSTLALLLEHMGLASPTRYVFVLKKWNPWLESIDAYGLYLDIFHRSILTNWVVSLNYDPQTLKISPYVNNTLYTGQFFNYGNQHLLVPCPDPLGPGLNTVADVPGYVVGFLAESQVFLESAVFPNGAFYTGLTRDDVGGLKYLLSPGTTNYETLLPDVVGTGADAHSYVNGAWRPGVDKITFVPQPLDSHTGAFLPTNCFFLDSYIHHGKVRKQRMKRFISRPDFLFSAADIPDGSYYTRTSATNWLNNAAANGNLGGEGPGVIQPPVQIAFEKMGPIAVGNGYVSDGQVNFDNSVFWGSFDGSTNPPITYPIPKSSTNQTTLRMWIHFFTVYSNQTADFVWKPVGLSGATFAMQTSTNLLNWTTLFTLTNDGSVWFYYNDYPSGSSGFYRVAPQ